jgi:hypothetical protein
MKLPAFVICTAALAAVIAIPKDGHAFPRVSQTSDSLSNIEEVASGRRWKRCYWRDGERICHRRGRGYYDDGYYGRPGYWGPGVSLRFGLGDRQWKKRNYRDDGRRGGKRWRRD